METGFRFDLMGRAVPKNVINSFVARYNGTEIFRAEMGSGVAANPFLQFYTRRRGERRDRDLLGGRRGRERSGARGNNGHLTAIPQCNTQ